MKNINKAISIILTLCILLLATSCSTTVQYNNNNTAEYKTNESSGANGENNVSNTAVGTSNSIAIVSLLSENGSIGVYNELNVIETIDANINLINQKVIVSPDKSKIACTANLSKTASWGSADFKYLELNVYDTKTKEKTVYKVSVYGNKLYDFMWLDNNRIYFKAHRNPSQYGYTIFDIETEEIIKYAGTNEIILDNGDIIYAAMPHFNSSNIYPSVKLNDEDIFVTEAQGGTITSMDVIRDEIVLLADDTNDSAKNFIGDRLHLYKVKLNADKKSVSTIIDAEIPLEYSRFHITIDDMGDIYLSEKNIYQIYSLTGEYDNEKMFKYDIATKSVIDSGMTRGEYRTKIGIAQEQSERIAKVQEIQKTVSTQLEIESSDLNVILL